MIRRLACALLVLLAALGATWPTLANGFVYDDRQYVVENPVVRGEAPILGSSLGRPEQALWRPVTVATWRAQWTPPFGPGPYHAFDILLHAATSLALLLLAGRLGLPRLAGLFGALLFAVHPVHAEAVAWVTGRAEVLACLFVVLAWIAHLSPGRLAWGSLPLLAVACLAKENALVAPALFGLTDLALASSGRRVPKARLTALGVLVAGLFLARLAVLPGALPGDGPYHETALTGRLGVALTLVGQALRLLALPWPLRIHYDRNEFLLARPELLAIAGLAAAAIVLLWQRERRGALLLALVPVALIPVLHLVPIGEPFAERFLYLPSVPFCLAVGALLQAWSRRERRGAGWPLLLAAAMLAAAVPASRAAVATFRDDLSLWSHAARVAPRLAVVHYNLATFLERAERWLGEDGDRPGVGDELTRSLELDPRHPYAAWAHQSLGHLALGALGPGPPNPVGAAHHYRAALALEPGLVESRLDLAGVALTRPDLVTADEALALLGSLLSDPSVPPAQRVTADQILEELSAASAASGANGGELPESAGRSSPAGS